MKRNLLLLRDFSLGSVGILMGLGVFLYSSEQSAEAPTVVPVVDGTTMSATVPVTLDVKPVSMPLQGDSEDSLQEREPIGQTISM